MQKRNESAVRKSAEYCPNVYDGRAQPPPGKQFKRRIVLNSASAVMNAREYNANLNDKVAYGAVRKNYSKVNQNPGGQRNSQVQSPPYSLAVPNSTFQSDLKPKTDTGTVPYANRIDRNAKHRTVHENVGQHCRLFKVNRKKSGDNSCSTNGGGHSASTTPEGNTTDARTVKKYVKDNNKKKSTTVLASVLRNDHSVIVTTDSAERNVDYDSDSSECSGDLNKLEMMTAVDFDRDRYARFSIHEVEIKDYVRTITYKNCIEYCSKEFIQDKVVLVIRCGIGLLPMLCVRNGKARKVIALEQSNCIEYARYIIKDNMYSHKITLIQSTVHDLKELPYGLSQVDVIVSDFMGDCVLGQGDQMEQVIEARNRFLKPNGLMIPMSVTLYCQLLEQRRIYENQRIRKSKKSTKLVTKEMKKTTVGDGYDTDNSLDSMCCSWWNDVYGFDMRSKPEFLIEKYSESEDCSVSDEKHWFLMPEPIIAHFDPSKVVSTACELKEFNMYTCTVLETRNVVCKNVKVICTTPFTSAHGGDYAHMLEFFMVVDFPNGKFGQHLYKNEYAEDSIGFSTSSFSPYTRYRQTGLLLRDELIVRQGDEFKINEFHMWRGPQLGLENKLFKRTSNANIYKKIENDENLKLCLKYTFVNKIIKAIDRRCAYVLVKHLF